MMVDIFRHSLFLALVTALLLFLVACQYDKKEQPTLSDEKIARILADAAVADAATQVLSGFPKDSLAHLYYMQILEMQGTTQDEYEKNLRILSDDPAHMEAVLKMAEKLVAPPEKPVQ